MLKDIKTRFGKAKPPEFLLGVSLKIVCNSDRVGSDQGASDLGILAGGEFLAEDRHPVSRGIGGLCTELDTHLGVHETGTVGEHEIAQGILPIATRLDSHGSGELPQVVTGHGIESVKRGGFENGDGIHLVGSFQREQDNTNGFGFNIFLKVFLRSSRGYL